VHIIKLTEAREITPYHGCIRTRSGEDGEVSNVVPLRA
jgi:hypothetical protein